MNSDALAAESTESRPRTLVAVAHGTASLPGQETIQTLLDEIRKLRPELQVEVCYLDVLVPGLGDLLEDEPEAIVVPMLLCTGYHVLSDIPAIVRRYPEVSVARHLGPDRSISTALAERLAALELPEGPRRAIGLIAGGSSVPAAMDDLAGAAADLAEVTGHEVYPLTINDSLPAQIEELQISAVATYLLAEGYFFHRLRTLIGSLVPVTYVIGAHPQVAELVLRRYDEAVSATL